MNLVFLVDTDSYSGNFSGEMCAYMTGNVGPSIVGRDLALNFLEKYETPLKVNYVPSEYGKRPEDIFPTPGLINNGFGFHFKEGEESLALEKAREFLRKDFLLKIEYLSNTKLLDVNEKTTRIEKVNKEIEDLKNLTLSKYKAYCSVGIYVEELNDDIISILKERAYEFAEKTSIKVSGFRIMSIKSKEV